MTDQAQPNGPLNTGSKKDSFPMLCHLSALATLVFPFGNFIAPLVLWLVKRDDNPEVEKHGREVLRFQGAMVFYALILCVFTMIPILGWIIGPFLFLVFFVLFLYQVIRGTMAANKGEWYEYPWKLNFISNIIDGF